VDPASLFERMPPKTGSMTSSKDNLTPRPTNSQANSPLHSPKKSGTSMQSDNANLAQMDDAVRKLFIGKV